MDYDAYAPTYARARWAVPWLVSSLAAEVERVPTRSLVLEIGCGTGNYVEALGERLPDRRYVAFDRSQGMLREATRRDGRGGYFRGDADRGFPVRSRSVALAFAVDVLHHLTDYAAFFGEVGRVLQASGAFVAVTDSEWNLRRRSLTRYFPEVLAVELERYPTLDELDRRALAAGLGPAGRALAEGHLELDDGFLGKLEARCSSAMRLIPEEAHRRGMERVREARQRGERWLSSYSVLRFVGKPA
jgi:SAM-dependent methyltransferase